MNRVSELLRDNPIIAAIKDEAGLASLSETDCSVVFILYGNIISIPDIVHRIKALGKTAFVHMDLIDGMAAKEVAVEYIATNTEADGIISTKVPIVNAAHAHGLLTVHRFFVLDSKSLAGIDRQLLTSEADSIEILPGVMPKVIRRICASTEKPVIAGGLICDKEDVMNAIAAGACGISTSNPSVWRE